MASLIHGQKVYLAARYLRREEMLAVRADLLKAHFVVTSRWIDGNPQANAEHSLTNVELMARFARENLEDLRTANIVVSFQEVPRESVTNRSGRHVEFGYALALGQPIICIGPLEHIFTALPQIQRFDDWPSALAFFQALWQKQEKRRLLLRHKPWTLESPA